MHSTIPALLQQHSLQSISPIAVNITMTRHTPRTETPTYNTTSVLQLEQPEQEVTENETKPFTHYIPHSFYTAINTNRGTWPLQCRSCVMH